MKITVGIEPTICESVKTESLGYLLPSSLFSSLSAKIQHLSDFPTKKVKKLSIWTQKTFKSWWKRQRTTF